MQAVILAAGRGKRMGKLTEENPKPLLEYKGQSLIEQKLSILPADISEIIIVIGYLGEKIISTLGNSYKNIPIRYVWQKEFLGTAHALWCCCEFLHDKFIVLMSDDIYDATDISKISDTPEWGALIFESDEKTHFGKCIADETGNMIGVVEDFTGSLPYTYIYTGVCVLDAEIFTTKMVKINSTEYGLPQTFVKLAGQKKIKMHFTKNWKRITSEKDLQ